MHVEKQERPKFDDRNENIIFISYDEGSRHYKLVNQKNNNTIIGCNSKFNKKHCETEVLKMKDLIIIHSSIYR